MKPRACVVVASEMTVRVFLARPLAAMHDQFDLTVVLNTTNPAFLQELGIAGRLYPLAIVRPVAPWSDLKALWRLLRLMQTNRFDLVQSVTPKAGLLAMIAAWLSRVPVRVHTFTGQVWVTRRGLWRTALKQFDKILAHTATCTLADSPSQRQLLIDQGIVSENKISVIGRGSICGVDDARFRPQPTRRPYLRERLGIGAADQVLLFVGRLNRDKGVLDLAEAFTALADERGDVRLLVVGPDEEGMRPAMRVICRRHLSRVRFLEFTTTPEDVMAASDVLCLPSYREGFGTVIIEAAAVGLPTVASRINGVTDAVEEERTGLLYEPADTNALVAQLRRITGDATLRRSLGEAARKRASQDFSQSQLTAARLDLYARLLKSGRNSWYRGVGKRACDVAGALLALVLLLPLAMAVAIIVRLSLGSPILFWQPRPGLHGVPFVLVKFRSMTDARDAEGGHLPDAERLTRTGRWLRASSLDEIPQLWNVLTGDMSLVGPRPLLMEYLPRYSAEQARRHSVKPGITGLVQVSGRNRLSWPRRLALDVHYADTYSLWLDLQIVARTLWRVVARHGISEPGHASSRQFLGTLDS
jgi:lipopolysaccharide/colanic/teichoic acid biosynthesis glycosyltransferase